MDAKITLSFDEDIIKKAKKYAKKNNISLSRLTEFLLRKATGDQYQSLEDLPIADWVNMISEGKVEYLTKPRRNRELKQEYFKSGK
ncbi:MAG TPA: DUF6364 family protein [Puia sp.]|nr:DUF6364 family protein [Puia sp.]